MIDILGGIPQPVICLSSDNGTYTNSNVRVNVHNFATLQITAPSAYSSEISNNGTVNVDGLGTFALNGHQEYIGAITGAGAVLLSGGVLRVENGSGTFSGALGNANTIDAGSVRFDGGTTTFAGTGYYTNTTTLFGGNLVLSGSIAPSYRIALESGTLRLAAGAANHLGDSTNVIVNGGGIFDLNGQNETVGGIGNNNGAGMIALNGGTLTLTNTGRFAGRIAQTAGNLRITGGTATFTNASLDYTGTTSIGNGATVFLEGIINNNASIDIAGRLILQGPNYVGRHIGDSTILNFASTGDLEIDSQNEAVGALTGSGNVFLRNGALTISQGSGIFSGAIDGVGQAGVGLTIAGGTTTLSGANTYIEATNIAHGQLSLSGSLQSYETNITGGTLRLLPGSTDHLMDGGLVRMEGGGTLDLNGQNEAIGELTSSGNGQGFVALNGGTLTLTGLGPGGGSVPDWTGNIMSGGNLVIQEGFQQRFASANLYTGTTTIGGIGADGSTHSARLDLVDTSTSSGSIRNSNTINIVDGSLRLYGENGFVSDNHLGDSATVNVGANGRFELTGIRETIGSLNGNGIVSLNNGPPVNGTSRPAALILTNGGAFGGFVLGPGRLVASGGTTTLTAGASVTAGIDAQGGILRIDQGAQISADLSLTGGLVNFSGGGNISSRVGLNFGSSSSGSGGTGFDVDANVTTILDLTMNIPFGSGIRPFVKSGLGTLSVATFQDYSGTTEVRGGILRIADDTNLGGAISGQRGGLILNGGALNVAGGGSLSFILTRNGTRGARDFQFNTATGGGIDVDSGATMILDRTLSLTGSGNAGAFVKSGLGILSVTAAQSYGGSTNINMGVFEASNNAAFGTSSGQINLNGGILRIGRLGNGNQIGLAIANNIVLNADSSIDVDSGDSGTLSGIVGNGGVARSLTKTGLGSLLLSGTNSYGGATNIAGGTLAVSGSILNSNTLNVTGGGTLVLAAGAANRLSDTSIVNVASGLLDVQSGDETIGRLTGAGGVSLNGATLTLSNSNGTYSGAISDGTFGSGSHAGSLVLGGTGTTTLSGNSLYTGSTTLSGGQLTLSGSLLGSANVNIAGGTLLLSTTRNHLSDAAIVNVASGGTFNLNGRSETVGALSGAGNVSLNGATLSLANGSGVFSGSIAATAGSVAISGGTTIFSGANRYLGSTMISGGTLRVTGAGRIGSAPTLTINGGTFDLNGLNLSVDSLAGSGGTLNLNGGSFTVGNGTDTSYAGTITSAVGGNFTKTGSGTLTLAGLNNYSGTTTVSAGSLAGSVFNTGSSFGASAIIDNANLSINADGGTQGNFGNIVSGAGSLTKTGIGSVRVTGANTYRGGTAIIGGTLIADNNGALGQNVAGNNVSVAANATLQIGALTGAGSQTRSVRIGGSYTQGVNSSLSVVLNAAQTGGTGTGSHLNIAGDADIATSGTLLSLLTSDPASAYLVGTHWNVLTAGSFNAGHRAFSSVLSDPQLAFLQSFDSVSRSIIVTLAANSTAGIDYNFDSTGTIGTSGTLDLNALGTANLGAVAGFAGMRRLQGANNTIATARQVTVGAGGAILDVAERTSRLTLDGTIDDAVSGAGGVVFNGLIGSAGTIMLRGDNSYSGGTKIVGGTVIADHAHALGRNSAGNNVALGSGGTLQIGAVSGVGSQTRDVRVGGGYSQDAGSTLSVVLTAAQTGGIGVGSHLSISGNADILNGGGAGNETVLSLLTSDLASNYLVGTQWNVLTASSFTAGHNAFDRILSDSQLVFTQAFDNAASSITVTLAASSAAGIDFDFDSAGTVGTSGTLDLNSLGTANLGAVNGFVGMRRLEGINADVATGRQFTIGVAGAILDVADRTGRLSIDGTIADAAPGAGRVTFNGLVGSAGTIALRGDNSYSGGTRIAAGRVIADHDHALGGASGGAVTVDADANLQIGATSQVRDVQVGGSYSQDAGSTLSVVLTSAQTGGVGVGSHLTIGGNADIASGAGAGNWTTLSLLTSDPSASYLIGTRWDVLTAGSFTAGHNAFDRILSDSQLAFTQSFDNATSSIFVTLAANSTAGIDYDFDSSGTAGTSGTTDLNILSTANLGAVPGFAGMRRLTGINHNVATGRQFTIGVAGALLDVADQTSHLTIDGTIDDAGPNAESVTFNGLVGSAGTITLSGNNSYTGFTSLKGGIIEANHDNAFGAAAGLVTLDGGMLRLGRLGNGAQTGLDIANAIALAQNSTIDVDSGDSGTLAGMITQNSGGLSLTKSGGGRLILDNNVTITSLLISGGSLGLGVNGNLGNGTNVTVDSAAANTLDLGNNHDQGVASLVLRRGTINGTGTSMLTAATYDLRSGTVNARLGTNTLTKNSAGTVILNNSSASDDVVVNDGLLTLAISGSLNGVAHVTVTGSTTSQSDSILELDGVDQIVSSADLTLGNATAGTARHAQLQLRSGAVATLASINGNGDIIFGGNSRLTLSTNNAATSFAGNLVDSSSNSGMLAKAGSQTLTLNSANDDFTGTLSIEDGALSFGAGGSIAADIVNVTANASRDVDLNLSGDNLTGTAPTVTLASIASHFANLNLLAGNAEFSGTITGTGRVIRNGGGNYILSGANSYKGGTFIATGSLIADNDNALGSASATTNSLTNNAILQLGQGGGPSRHVVIGGDYSEGRGATFSVVLSGGSGNSSSLSARDVTLASDGHLAVLAQGLTNTYARGDAYTILSWSGTFSGGAIDNAGGGNIFNDLTSSNPSLLFAQTNMGHSLLLTVASTNGTVGIDYVDDSANAVVGPVNAPGLGALTTANLGATARDFRRLIDNDMNAANSNDVVTSRSFTIAAAGAGLDVANARDHLTIAGAITDAGGGFSGTGMAVQFNSLAGSTGTITLSGTNTFHGGVSINGGMVEANIDGAFGDGDVILGGGGLRIGQDEGSGLAPVATAFTLANAIRLNGATNEISVAQSDTGTLSGAINGGNLTKVGLGTLVLGNTVNIASLDVNGGSLRVTAPSTLANSTIVTVNSASDFAFDLGNGNDQDVASLILRQGAIIGNSTLTAATYDLRQGSVDVNLGSGALTKSGSGTVVLDGAVDADSIAVNDGTLVVGNGVAQLGTTDITVSGSGSGQSNLQLTNLLQFANLTHLTLTQSAGNAAVLDLQAIDSRIQLDRLDGNGDVLLAGGNSEFVLGTNGGASHFSGLVSGANRAVLGTLTKEGQGIFTLDGEIETSNINIHGGTLSLGTHGKLGFYSSLSLGDNEAGAGHLILNGDQQVGDFTLRRNSDVIGTGTLRAAAYNLEQGSIKANLGDGTINKNNFGNTATIVDIDGNTGLGAMNVLGGELRLNGMSRATVIMIDNDARLTLLRDDLLNHVASVTVNGTGSVLDIGTHDQTIGTLDLRNGGTISQTTGILRVISQNLYDGTVNTDLSGGILSKVDDSSSTGGTVTVNGRAAVSNVTVNGGMLVLNHAGGHTLSALNGAPNDAYLTISAGTLQASGDEDLGRGIFTLGSFAARQDGLLLHTGSGTTTLTAAMYNLEQGTIGSVTASNNIHLGVGTLNKYTAGLAVLDGTSAANVVNVAGGNLTTGSAHRFVGTAVALNIASGAVLALGGDESFASLDGGGSLDVAGHGVTAGGGTFAGAIGSTGGGGTFTKAGAGTVTLSGANGYADTTVLSGTLIADNNAALGVATGSIINNATLQIGITSPRTITAGSYVGGANAIFSVILTPNQGSRLNVTGTADIAGLLSLLPRGAGTTSRTPYIVGTNWTVLHADGGISGEFDSLVQSGSAFLHFTQALDPTHHDIIVTLASIDAGSGNNPEDLIYTGVCRTANCDMLTADLGVIAPDGIALSGNPDTQLVINNILGLDAGEARRAFDEIAGSFHADVITLTRNSVIGFMSMTGNRASQGSSFVSSLDANASPFSDRAALSYARAALPENSILNHGWVRAYGSFGRLESDRSAEGADYRNSGLAFGIDQNVTEDTVLGLALGYTNTNASGKRFQDSAEIDSYEASLYGKVQRLPLDLYISGQAGYAFHDIGTERKVVFGAIDRSLKASENNHSLFGNFELGRTFDVVNDTASLGRAGSTSAPGGFTVTLSPHAGVDYIHQFREAFQERGGNFLDLSLDGRDDDSLRIKAGIDAEANISLSEAMRLALKLDLGYAYETLDNKQSFEARLDDSASRRFRVDGPKLDRNYALVGAGFAIDMPNQHWLGAEPSFFVNYGGEYSGSSTIHEVTGGLSLRW
ncbi:MAG TPA: autotransporter-associated beta strand repeat-containing protein [Dongiaceae bacterium]|nr:autotransporter-associated beta strand repeat-containing protein [Dongiaceae bacterium]